MPFSSRGDAEAQREGGECICRTVHPLRTPPIKGGVNINNQSLPPACCKDVLLRLSPASSVKKDL